MRDRDRDREREKREGGREGGRQRDREMGLHLGIHVWDAKHHDSTPIMVIKVYPLRHLQTPKKRKKETMEQKRE